MLKLKYLFENFELAKECMEFYQYDKETQDTMMSFFRISSNAIYPFRTGEEAETICFLRLSPAEEKSLEDVVTEVSLIEWLIEKDFPAMKPVPMKDGGFVKQVTTKWGTFNVSCFEKVPGESLEDIQGIPNLAKGYGNILGKLHAQLKDYPCPDDRRNHKALLKEIGERLEKYEVPEIVKEEYRIVCSELEQLPISLDTYGIIHYDFELDNVFYDAEQGMFSVIDFDDALCCWYSLDVVRALDALDEFVEESQVQEAEQCFLEGYRSAINFTEEQQQSFSLMRRLVHLQEYATILHVMSEPPVEIPDWMYGLLEKLKCKLYCVEELLQQAAGQV